MAEYVGMDVSLEEVSICVMDGSGRVLARGTTPTDPAAIVAFIEEQAPDVVRIVHESGQISIWLTRELRALGAPVICIDARMAPRHPLPSYTSGFGCGPILSSREVRNWG